MRLGQFTVPTGHVAAVGRMGVQEEEHRKGERMLSGNGLVPDLHPQQDDQTLQAQGSSPQFLALLLTLRLKK